MSTENKETPAGTLEPKPQTSDAITGAVLFLPHWFFPLTLNNTDHSSNDLFLMGFVRFIQTPGT